MKNVILLMSVSLCLFCIGCDSKEKVNETQNQQVEEKMDPIIKQKAVESAEQWLSLIDSEKYAESWDEAAEFFKNSITKENWLSAVLNARSSFGNNLKREIISATFTKTLPGAPDGEYVVIQFEGQFENKEKSLETITSMKDPDGKWRVSGYFIK